MERNANSTTWGRYKTWTRSLPVRAALVPLVGFAVARSSQNVVLGLGGAVAMAFCILIGMQIEDRLRRKREAREHIAGLARW